MHFATKLLHTGSEIDPHTGAASVPIYQVSTFGQKSLEEPGVYDYARSGNPTRQALEEIIAQLEGGVQGFAFASGMAATSTVLLLLNPGDHLIVSEDIYGGTYRVLTRVFSRLGIIATFTDTSNLDNIKQAITSQTKALFLESPSNPLLKITDLAGAATIARQHNLLTIVDNTFMTPYLQRPLELGADIVIHSATKYLGGHSDVIAGLAVVKDPERAKELYFLQNCFGAILAPHDSWLVMRGIKTLKVRMDQQQATAHKIAEWLVQQPEVKEVYYPGLPNHPGHKLAGRQADGFGAIISFKAKSVELARHLLNNVKIPILAVSLGAVESIISYPSTMSHAAIPSKRRLELGVTDDLIRLSVGLEEAEDLIEDLRQAIDSCGI
ncbi:MAG: trans-sulfuration enzyme family protein [Thermincolia bacterium]